MSTSTANTTSRTDTGSVARGPGRRRIIAMLLVLGMAVAAILYLVIASRQGGREAILGEEAVSRSPARETDINVGQVIDAVKNRDVEAREGYRYRVVIDGRSKEGTAGVAHIGGLVTFVPGARKGDVAIVQVTAVKRSVANAELVRVVGAAADARPEAAVAPEDIIDVSDNIVEKTARGNVYRGTIAETGQKGDGIIRVGGKVVFVPGVRKGDLCVFRIVETRDRFDRGELVRIEGKSPAQSGGKARAGKEISQGEQYIVTISQKDRKNPDRDGVAKIDGLVVFVPGTQPGDKVKIEITEKKPRFARALVVERCEL